MTRSEALDAVRKLAAGLTPDLAGCARLLARVANHDDAEALRDVLTEAGARALLEGSVEGKKP